MLFLLRFLTVLHLPLQLLWLVLICILTLTIIKKKKKGKTHFYACPMAVAFYQVKLDRALTFRGNFDTFTFESHLQYFILTCFILTIIFSGLISSFLNSYLFYARLIIQEANTKMRSWENLLGIKYVINKRRGKEEQLGKGFRQWYTHDTCEKSEGKGIGRKSLKQQIIIRKSQPHI